jgi:hypothetical protein
MTNAGLTVSIMPLYQCHNNCGYCYLGNLRKDTTVLPVEEIDTILSQQIIPYLQGDSLCKPTHLSNFEVYGGDLNLLPVKYLQGLKKVLSPYNVPINVVVSNPSLAVRELFDYVTVSINVERKDFADNLQSFMKYNVGAITVLRGPEANMSPARLLERYNGCTGKLVTFMQPSYSVLNPCSHNFLTHIDEISSYVNRLLAILQEWYYNREYYTFEITNYHYLAGCVAELESGDMNRNVFITPTGSLACIEFERDTYLEYFRPCVSMHDWEYRCLRDMTKHIECCATCKSYRNCPSDHYRILTNKQMADCSYPKLIEWYKGHNSENNNGPSLKNNR